MISCLSLSIETVHVTGDHNIINKKFLMWSPKDRHVVSLDPSTYCKHNFKIIMDSAENYARQWAKRKNGDFSEWVKSVRSLI